MANFRVDEPVHVAGAELIGMVAPASGSHGRGQLN